MRTYSYANMQWTSGNQYVGIWVAACAVTSRQDATLYAREGDDGNISHCQSLCMTVERSTVSIPPINTTITLFSVVITYNSRTTVLTPSTDTSFTSFTAVTTQDSRTTVLIPSINTTIALFGAVIS